MGMHMKATILNISIFLTVGVALVATLNQYFIIIL